MNFVFLLMISSKLKEPNKSIWTRFTYCDFDILYLRNIDWTIGCSLSRLFSIYRKIKFWNGANRTVNGRQKMKKKKKTISNLVLIQLLASKCVERCWSKQKNRKKGNLEMCSPSFFSFSSIPFMPFDLFFFLCAFCRHHNLSGIVAFGGISFSRFFISFFHSLSSWYSVSMLCGLYAYYRFFGCGFSLFHTVIPFLLSFLSKMRYRNT